MGEGGRLKQNDSHYNVSFLLYQLYLVTFLRVYYYLYHLCTILLILHYPLAQQSCGGDIGSVPYVCM